MRRLALAGVSILLAACRATASSAPPSATPSTSPDASPSVSPSPVVEGLVLEPGPQALPPAQTFGWGSSLVIADGKAIVPGPMLLIYPGPLLPPLVERPITPLGINRVLEAAGAVGLLAGPDDLTGGIHPAG